MRVAILLGLALGVAAAVCSGAPARAQVVPHTASAALPDSLVANASRAVIGCPRGIASVRGSGNVVTVDGRCTSLRVAGSDNLVSAALAIGGIVTVDGDRNRVVYAGTVAPEAVTHGFYDEVVREAPLIAPTPRAVAVAPAPDTSVLVLEPTSPAFDVACTDRDVLIRGDAQNYVLRGGCRSLTVEGKLNTITAELRPGAQVLIGGPGVLLNYVLTGQGPAPTVRVTAPGLRAEQIQHFGSSQLSLQTYR